MQCSEISGVGSPSQTRLWHRASHPATSVAIGSASSAHCAL
jgi:hypothetical protein